VEDGNGQTCLKRLGHLSVDQSRQHDLPRPVSTSSEKIRKRSPGYAIRWSRIDLLGGHGARLWTSTTSLGLFTPRTVRKVAWEWEQAFTDTIPKEAYAEGWVEAPAVARLAGPNLRQHAWPSNTLSPTTSPLWFSQTPKDS